MAICTEDRVLTVRDARNVFTEEIGDEYDVEKLMRFLLAELMAQNNVVLVICVGRETKPKVHYEDI